MADAHASVRYRGIEGHACPRCAREGVWTHLRWLLGRDGKVKWLSTTSDKRLYRDDADLSMVDAAEEGDFPDDRPSGKPGARWIHFFPVECPRCMTLFNRQTYVYHVFDDKDLPLDYWADHEANVALMRAHGIDEKKIEMHEQLLARLGMRRPRNG